MRGPCFRLWPYANASTPLPVTRPSTLPITMQRAQWRPFSHTSSCQSNVGRAPISIPPSVTFNVIPPAAPKYNISRPSAQQAQTSTVQIKGPLGEMSMSIPSFVKITHNPTTGKAVVEIEDKMDKTQKQMWGTTRAYLANHVLGVSEGHTTLLRLVGVGYRATIESSATTVSPQYPGQKFVSLKLGYSHPIELGVPEGVTASTPQPTRILLEGKEKQVVNEFAAVIRKWRVPEPYKGKGIFVNDETIKLKAKKIK